MSSMKRKRGSDATAQMGTTADLFAGIERRSAVAETTSGGAEKNGEVKKRKKKKRARIDPKGSLETATQSDLEFSRLLDQFNPNQLQRYEFFRRSSLPKNKVRRFMEEVLAGAGVGPRGVVKDEGGSPGSGVGAGSTTAEGTVIEEKVNAGVMLI